MKQWWLKFKAPHLKGVKITVREKEPTKELADVCTIISVVCKSDYDKLEARCKELEEDNRILKAKLELAIKQRNLSLAGWFCSADTRNDHIVLLKKRKFDKELDSIGSEK